MPPLKYAQKPNTSTHPQEKINQAYQEAFKLAQKSLSEIEITEILIQKGFPEDLAHTASVDNIIDKEKSMIKYHTLKFKLSLGGMIFGFLILILSIAVTQNYIFIPGGLIIICGFLAYYSNSEIRKSKQNIDKRSVL